MGEKLHKDILFYSNLDEYSTKIVQTLSTKNEKDNFIYICVDDPNIQLPTFLTVVPTICFSVNVTLIGFGTLLSNR